MKNALTRAIYSRQERVIYGYLAKVQERFTLSPCQLFWGLRQRYNSLRICRIRMLVLVISSKKISCRSSLSFSYLFFLVRLSGLASLSAPFSSSLMVRSYSFFSPCSSMKCSACRRASAAFSTSWENLA